MQFPNLITTSMIQANINRQTYFFTVSHITREANNKLIYGIRLNHTNYFLSKTQGVEDVIQLDTNPALEKDVLAELNKVITQAEFKYKKRPPVERMNRDIFSLLIKLRNYSTGRFKPAII